MWDLTREACFYFRIQPKIKGTRKLLEKNLGDVIRQTDYPGLDLVPADLSYRNFDVALNNARNPAVSCKNC